MPISCRAAAKGVTIACLLGSLVLAPVTEACTRILRNTSTFAVFVERTMDFPVSTEPLITMLPRGMARAQETG